jgi:flagellar basal body rod protein FlgC
MNIQRERWKMVNMISASRSYQNNVEMGDVTAAQERCRWWSA